LTTFDLEQTIRERRSIRLFLSQPVPPELINEALALAVLAPSNSNLQLWHLVLVSGPGRERLVHALLEAAQKGPPISRPFLGRE
jgi:nitroreductase